MNCYSCSIHYNVLNNLKITKRPISSLTSVSHNRQNCFSLQLEHTFMPTSRHRTRSSRNLLKTFRRLGHRWLRIIKYPKDTHSLPHSAVRDRAFVFVRETVRRRFRSSSDRKNRDREDSHCSVAVIHRKATGEFTPPAPTGSTYRPIAITVAHKSSYQRRWSIN